MIGWSIVAVYVLGWLYTGVAFARWRKQQDIEQFGIRTAQVDQWATLGQSMAMAAFWPAWAPFWALRSQIVAVGNRLLKTDVERREALDAELATLRRQARELGLPYPGEGR